MIIWAHKNPWWEYVGTTKNYNFIYISGCIPHSHPHSLHSRIVVWVSSISNGQANGIHTIISAGDGQHTCANHQHGSPIKMTLTTTAPMCYTWPRKVKCGLKGQVFGWSWFVWQESLTVTSENLWQGEQGWDLAVQVSGSGLVTNIE